MLRLGFCLSLSLFAGLGRCYAQRADTVLNAPVTAAANIEVTHRITLDVGFSGDGNNGAIGLSIVSLSVQNCVPLAATPSVNQNYQMTLVARQPFDNAETLASQNTCGVMQTVQYFDGLGRPLQTVQVKANPDATRDVIVPVAYDVFGREVTKYLPYTTGMGTPGSYRADALNGTSGYGNSAQLGFYQATGQNYVRISTPSASTAFEPSPLGRPLEQGAPGDVWQLSSSGITGAGHTVRMEYNVNDLTSLSTCTGYPAKQFDVAFNNSGIRSLTDNGTYPAGELTVTISKDENWTSGKNHTTETYQDKKGRTILKRTFNNSEVLSTYYVYDDFSNLCYVLPPKAEADGATTSSPMSTAILNSLCYQYRYDERQRLTQKRIPGSGWQYTVYNRLNQDVAMQDSNQRVQKQWIITKYDAQGRTLMSGIWNNGNTAISPEDLKAQVYAQTVEWEHKDNTQANGYTINNTYPTSLNTVLSVNYYDDYDIAGLPTIYDHHTENSALTYGLPTASKVNVLGTSDMLWTVNYYDDKGRITNTYAQHYLGGAANLNPANYDHVSNTYDFANEVTNTLREHYSNSTGTPNLALTVRDSLAYDHIGRKRQTWSKINNDNIILLSQNDYNEIGQALTKHLHSEDGGVSYLQNVNYGYNERGWMTRDSSDKFNLRLAYNTGITTGAMAQYNGNIAEMYSASEHTAANSKMKYGYDALNRLLSADHNNGTLTENGITYDKMGNIVTLNRNGSGSATLGYTYSGNQLTAVTNGGGTFKTYAYDGNGNATTDGTTKGISYNLLNLPQTVTNTATSATLATYTYEAGGAKIRNTGTDGTWDYDNGIVYHNGAIDFVSTEEGRAIPNGGTYSYQYNLKDHLGNDRVSMDKNGVLQEDEYYAFGLRNPKYDNSNNNRYLYNGKEIQTDLANQYDYGARFYDAVIGRWTSVDALAEHPNQISRSPYAYGWNNPVKYTDPDGNCPICLVLLVEAIEAATTAEVVTATVVAAGSTAIIMNTARHLSNDRPVMTRDGFSRSPIAAEPIRKSDDKDESGSKTPKDPTANRVKPRKGTKEQVAGNQPKNDKGEMLDPNTGQVLDPEKTDLGHKPGQEWSKRKKEHQEKGNTRKEVIEAENDPNLYQYEDRSSNRSHKHEQKPEKKT